MPEKSSSVDGARSRRGSGDDFAAALAKVRDALVALAGVAGGLKIYPLEHASIAAGRAEAWSKLRDLLESRWEIDLVIEPTTFLYEGVIAYAESNLPRSLPHALFEAGLRRLIFRRGLGEEEFDGFLALLRRAALLPPGDNDLTVLLWERDFANIGHVDSDDYLEAKIGAVDRRPWEKLPDPASLTQGRIDLRPEDVQAIVQRRSIAAADETEGAGREDKAGEGALSSEEKRFLETAFGAERSIPAESSFLDLFFELLCLEDRPSALASMLQFADKHHQELIQRYDYLHAGLLLARLDDLQAHGTASSPIKVQDLERVARRIKDAVSLASLKEQAMAGRVDDPAAFFAYLGRIGPRALPLAADLFEEQQDGVFRSEAFGFLKGVGEQSLDVLAGLARDSLPFLSKAVVLLLGNIGSRRAVPYLARFRDSVHKAVRLETVRALAGIQDALAAKILKSFLADADPEVREAARTAGAAGEA